jgi:hypothetical protein
MRYTDDSGSPPINSSQATPAKASGTSFNPWLDEGINNALRVFLFFFSFNPPVHYPIMAGHGVQQQKNKLNISVTIDPVRLSEG